MLIQLGMANKTPQELTTLLLDHGSRQQVAEFGCWRAKAMASESLQSLLEIVSAGGAQAIVAAMRSHKNLTAVQEDGCGALAYIASGDDHCRQVRQCGVQQVEAFSVSVCKCL